MFDNIWQYLTIYHNVSRYRYIAIYRDKFFYWWNILICEILSKHLEICQLCLILLNNVELSKSVELCQNRMENVEKWGILLKIFKFVQRYNISSHIVTSSHIIVYCHIITIYNNIQRYVTICDDMRRFILGVSTGHKKI